MSSGEAPRLVQSVSRAVRIIETLAPEAAGLRLSTLAGRVELPVQTLQGLLRTLEYHGLVTQAGYGAPYLLGSKVTELAQLQSGRDGRAEIARPAVDACRDALGENVVLAELRGGTLFPLVQSMAEGELAVGPAVPLSDTIHLRATGRILLAELSGKERQSILSHADFTAGGTHAPSSADDLCRELSRIAKLGVACTRDVAADGIAALAVGVKGQKGRTLAALGCNLPTARLNRRRQGELVAGLREGAARIASLWETVS